MNRMTLMILKNLWRIPWVYGKLCHYARNTEDYSEEEKYEFMQYIVGCAAKAGKVDLQVFGKENIPEEDGFMMYANHPGMFDFMTVVSSFDRPMGLVLKNEVGKWPLLKQMAKCTNSFPMDTEDIRQSLGVINAVTEEVKKGRNYLIFPEGTRNKSRDTMLEFHAGSFKCATKARCPILPIALIDSHKVLDGKGKEPVTVQIHYLELIPYEEYAGMSTVELARMVRERIGKVIGQKDC
ncbi:MAG: 1-acyl-sn-glycerol-3-phosphate acyltransferase [Lachnospiraceae bacterium]|nr:1-acyl-sn-glycerol-3-phosphate acyltransferase [Lachnospiraceae bacterium]